MLANIIKLEFSKLIHHPIVEIAYPTYLIQSQWWHYLVNPPNVVECNGGRRLPRPVSLSGRSRSNRFVSGITVFNGGVIGTGRANLECVNCVCLGSIFLSWTKNGCGHVLDLFFFFRHTTTINMTTMTINSKVTTHAMIMYSVLSANTKQWNSVKFKYMHNAYNFLIMFKTRSI